MKNNVIYNIIDLLNSDEWYGISKEIEIAKGKYKLKRNFKELKYQFIRNLYFLLKKTE